MDIAPHVSHTCTNDDVDVKREDGCNEQEIYN